jgi:hypothetical protein
MYGVACGVVFALSCGDNLSVKPAADAAVDAFKVPDAAPACDCPATEPPIAARFIVVNNTRTIPANGFSGQGAVCPMGSQPIFGSCTTDQLTPTRNMSLQQSGYYAISPREWTCFFRNNEDVPVTLRVSITCLKLAS